MKIAFSSRCPSVPGAGCFDADTLASRSLAQAEEQITDNCKLMTDDEFSEPVHIPITDVLDLHSVPPADVRGVVEAYLEEAHRLGFRALRVIHGKGIGVQREIVRSVLGRTEFVAAFSDAPAEAGGWGATIVDLKN